MINNGYKTIDEYIANYPKEFQNILKKLRRVIHKAAPEAQEVISYGMPAFKQNGILVYFAAYKHHIGFYPTSSGIAAFRNDLSAYETSKGTVRFPIGKPIPINLISKIVKFRVSEVLSKRSRSSEIRRIKR